MIARVFPTKTSMSPTDDDAYFGPPIFDTPHYDEVHISVSFTWDLSRAEFLRIAWKNYGDKVFVGGPACDDAGGEFVAGRYLRKGITITSRGCPNNCPFCYVPKREGKLRELPVVIGNIIQDNNFTSCSREHQTKVFEMLKTQKAVVFQGGLEAARIDDWFVEQLRSLRLKELWLAYDHDNADKPLAKAVNKLKRFFKRDKIRCYVLIGFGEDTIEKAESRLQKAVEIGVFPFAMLYKPKDYSADWYRFAREWIRPAIIRTKIAEVSK